MPADISFTFDDVLGRKRRQKREAEAATLAQNLLEKGVDPAAINQVTQNYVQTGNLQFPEMQTKMLPADENSPDGRSTRVPFGVDQKKKGLFTLDPTGQVTQVDTPDDMTDFEVRSVPAQKQPNTNKGHTFKIDRATGQMEDQGVNGKTFNDYVYWDSRSNRPAGGSAKDPQEDLAKDTIKKYQAALLRGDDIPDEFMDSVRSASDYLNSKGMNIDIAEVQKDPGIVDTVLGAGAAAVNKVTGKPTVSPPSPKFGGSSVRFQPKTGKPLTTDQAQKFLQQAGGDKNKARALAKAAGYTF